MLRRNGELVGYSGGLALAIGGGGAASLANFYSAARLETNARPGLAGLSADAM
jgi:hypothetical protein